MIITEGLKPCPFCGGQVMALNCEYDRKFWYITCGHCHIEFTSTLRMHKIGEPNWGTPKNNRDATIAAWNNRSED